MATSAAKRRHARRKADTETLNRMLRGSRAHLATTSGVGNPNALTIAAAPAAMRAVAQARLRREARAGQIVSWGTVQVVVRGAADPATAIEHVRTLIESRRPGLVRLDDDEFSVRVATPEELTNPDLFHLAVE